MECTGWRLHSRSMCRRSLGNLKLICSSNIRSDAHPFICQTHTQEPKGPTPDYARRCVRPTTESQCCQFHHSKNPGTREQGCAAGQRRKRGRVPQSHTQVPTARGPACWAQTVALRHVGHARHARALFQLRLAGLLLGLDRSSIGYLHF